VGLEPSAILSFRDEYRRFELETEGIEAIAAKCFLIEEFLASEISLGHISPELLTTAIRRHYRTRK